jgi:protocatechuate 3,4-dioxygenase beta subunit
MHGIFILQTTMPNQTDRRIDHHPKPRLVSSRIVVAGLLLVIAWVWWWRWQPTWRTGARSSSASTNRPDQKPGFASENFDSTSNKYPRYSVTGAVRDAASQPVGGALVRLVGIAGDFIATATTDGTFTMNVPIGTYHVMARTEQLMTIGVGKLSDFPTLQEAQDAITLAPTLSVSGNTVDVPIYVGQIFALSGQVVDRNGLPVVGAIVFTKDTQHSRPTFGVDIAISGQDGRYQLWTAYEMMSDSTTVFARHDELGLSTAWRAYEKISVDQDIDDTLELVAATPLTHADVTIGPVCVVRGRVDATDMIGLEVQIVYLEGQLHEGAHIFDDGSFAYSTAAASGDFSVVARNYIGHVSAPQAFHCIPGARFTNVNIKLDGPSSSLTGTVYLPNGTPAKEPALKLLSVNSSTSTYYGFSADNGRFSFAAVPPGEYRLRAQTFWGQAEIEVTVPSSNLEIQLIPSVIEGVVRGIDDAWVTFTFLGCFEPTDQLVHVYRGQYQIDAPMCATDMFAAHGGVTDRVKITTEPSTALIAVANLDLRSTLVHGRVVDPSGHPVRGADVYTMTQDDAGPVQNSQQAKTDGDGRFELEARMGNNQIYAYSSAFDGSETILVGENTNAPDVEIVLSQQVEEIEDTSEPEPTETDMLDMLESVERSPLSN